MVISSDGAQYKKSMLVNTQQEFTELDWLGLMGSKV
jgi:hypothetical protein